MGKDSVFFKGLATKSLEFDHVPLSVWETQIGLLLVSSSSFSSFSSSFSSSTRGEVHKGGGVDCRGLENECEQGT